MSKNLIIPSFFLINYVEEKFNSNFNLQSNKTEHKFSEKPVNVTNTNNAIKTKSNHKKLLKDQSDLKNNNNNQTCHPIQTKHKTHIPVTSNLPNYDVLNQTSYQDVYATNENIIQKDHPGQENLSTQPDLMSSNAYLNDLQASKTTQKSQQASTSNCTYNDNYEQVNPSKLNSSSSNFNPKTKQEIEELYQNEHENFEKRIQSQQNHEHVHQQQNNLPLNKNTRQETINKKPSNNNLHQKIKISKDGRKSFDDLNHKILVKPKSVIDSKSMIQQNQKKNPLNKITKNYDSIFSDNDSNLSYQDSDLVKNLQLYGDIPIDSLVSDKSQSIHHSQPEQSLRAFSEFFLLYFCFNCL